MVLLVQRSYHSALSNIWAIDHRSYFPLGFDVIQNEVSMDDVLSGAHTLAEARAKQRETMEMLQVGGFHSASGHIMSLGSSTGFNSLTSC